MARPYFAGARSVRSWNVRSQRSVDGSEPGAQIDWLLDGKDGVINRCEVKFSGTPYEISQKYAEQLRNKEDVFRRVTGTRKTVFVTMVSPCGVKANAHRQALIQGVVIANDLCEG